MRLGFPVRIHDSVKGVYSAAALNQRVFASTTPEVTVPMGALRSVPSTCYALLASFGSLQVLFRQPFYPLPGTLMSTCGASPWARTMGLRSARCLPIRSAVTGGRPR